MPVTLFFKRGRLPHWLVADRPYFVTIRLHGTLPAHVLTQITEERRRLSAAAPDENQLQNAHRREFIRLDAILDSCQNHRRWLANSDVAASVWNNFGWLEESRGWIIYAATLMPNHLHFVLRNDQGRNGKLISDLTQFKGFTACAANRILERQGPFWAREDFDHWCRDQEQLEKAMLYTIQNPVSAGLVSHWRKWRWTRVNPEYFQLGKVPD